MVYPHSFYKSPSESLINVIGPTPAYLKYFHNILEYGYADSVLHENEYTIDLIYADRQAFEAQLGGVKSITLEYNRPSANSLGEFGECESIPKGQNKEIY